tara:strand:- start:149 stop:385 length:237 start_codon:yes stop_codon:yes gene_type:complete
MIETKARSLLKSLVWRVIAIVNSFVILVSSVSERAIINALYMNISGFIIYYFFERVCNRISCGKVHSQKIGDSNDKSF